MAVKIVDSFTQVLQQKYDNRWKQSRKEAMILIIKFFCFDFYLNLKFFTQK